MQAQPAPPLHLWCAAYLCDGPVTVPVMQAFLRWAQLRWTRCICRADLVRQLVELATCDCPLFVLDTGRCRVTVFDASMQFDVPPAVARAAGGLLSPRGRLHRHSSLEFHRSCDMVRMWTRVLAGIELSFGREHASDCADGMVARPLCVALTAALAPHPNPMATAAVGENLWNAARVSVSKLRDCLLRYGSGVAAAMELRLGRPRCAPGWPKPKQPAAKPRKRRRESQSAPAAARCSGAAASAGSTSTTTRGPE
jgi:hypothetical protein